MTASEMVRDHVFVNVTPLIVLLEDREDFRPPEGVEAYEHWIVSEWLASELQRRDQYVLVYSGLHIWYRQGTGQAIRMDNVMEEIAHEQDR